MDPEIELQEETVKTKKLRNPKKSTSKVLKGLITCLWTGMYSNMLWGLDEEKTKFEVRFVNKLSKIWTKEDIGLFMYLDSLFEKKKRSKVKYDEEAKNRFRSNMLKLKKYIREFKPSRKESKSVMIRTYEIINLPSDVEKLVESFIRKSSKDLKDGNNEEINMQCLETNNFSPVGDKQRDFNNEMGNNHITINNTNNKFNETYNLGAIGGGKRDFNNEINKIIYDPSINGGERFNCGAVEEGNFMINSELTSIINPSMNGTESFNFGAAEGRKKGKFINNGDNISSNYTGYTDISSTHLDERYFNTFEVDSNVPNNNYQSEVNMPFDTLNPKEISNVFFSQFEEKWNSKVNLDRNDLNYESMTYWENETMFSNDCLKPESMDISEKSVQLPTFDQISDRCWMSNNFPGGFLNEDNN